jgi:flagellar basal-body rod protein FlgC
MNVFSKSLSVSASGLRVQAGRLNNVSQNIANSDTPGYRRKLTLFEANSSDTGGVALGKTQLDQSDLATIFDPSHPMADETGHFLGSNVDLIFELADAREAQRGYEANLKMFEQSRGMSEGLLDLLRR